MFSIKKHCFLGPKHLMFLFKWNLLTDLLTLYAIQFSQSYNKAQYEAICHIYLEYDSKRFLCIDSLDLVSYTIWTKVTGHHALFAHAFFWSNCLYSPETSF